MLKITTISMLCVTFLMSCSTLEPNAVSRLGDTPVLSGGTYTSGGGITVAADVRNDNGQTMVCGVWAQSVHQSVLTSHVERQVLGSGSVYLGKEPVVRGLVFMTEVEPMPDYSGQTAGCVRTDRQWQAGDDVKRARIRIPRQVVYFDGDEFTGGPIVYFYQSGPGAGGQN